MCVFAPTFLCSAYSFLRSVYTVEFTIIYRDRPVNFREFDIDVSIDQNIEKVLRKAIEN